MIYQTAVGTWPIETLDEPGWENYLERLTNYFEKALHEAKVHTSWLNPDELYDQTVKSFVRTIFQDPKSEFVKDLDRFARSIADAGFVNSLAQTLVKICVPGVPDFYQGVEFWDFALVDPDNRRPVDFRRRAETLATIRGASAQDHGKLIRELVTRWPNERIKLFLIWRTLQLRNQQIELFRGEYLPLVTSGEGESNVVAFARKMGRQWLACIVPRLGLPAWRTEAVSAGAETKKSQEVEILWPPGSWWRGTDIQLPVEAPAQWKHVFTDRKITTRSAAGARVLNAGELFEQFPVALLLGEASKR